MYVFFVVFGFYKEQHFLNLDGIFSFEVHKGIEKLIITENKSGILKCTV